jgi:hypothetical protein
VHAFAESPDGGHGCRALQVGQHLVAVRHVVQGREGGIENRQEVELLTPGVGGGEHLVQVQVGREAKVC